jgi:2-methylcitrate dehydratase PrpD
MVSNFPSQWPARVEVLTSSGRHEHTVTDVPGDPARQFDENTVRDKFRRLTRPVIGAEAAAQTLKGALGLFDGEAGIAGLFHLMEQASTSPRREEARQNR